jgi:hypothetical protein
MQPLAYGQKLSADIGLTSLNCKPGYRSDENREGKSGQHRATHRLIAGPGLDREESATENYRPGE